MCEVTLMVLIGHPSIPSPIFRSIRTQEEIAQTPPNSLLFFDFDVALATYCKAQNITFALHVKNTKELVLANALGAAYFVVDKALAINAQKVADDYLFDGKVLLLSAEDNDIEFAASYAIDGVLFGGGVLDHKPS